MNLNHSKLWPGDYVSLRPFVPSEHGHLDAGQFFHIQRKKAKAKKKKKRSGDDKVCAVEEVAFDLKPQLSSSAWAPDDNFRLAFEYTKPGFAGTIATYECTAYDFYVIPRSQPHTAVCKGTTEAEAAYLKLFIS